MVSPLATSRSSAAVESTHAAYREPTAEALRASGRKSQDRAAFTVRSQRASIYVPEAERVAHMLLAACWRSRGACESKECCALYLIRDSKLKYEA